jgi:hypothetical protein
VSTGRRALVLIAVLTTYLAVTLPILQSVPGGAIEPLDAQFFYSPDVAFTTLASYGQARRFWIVMYVTWDVGNPVLYSLALAMSLSWLGQRLFGRETRAHALALLPFLAAVCDLLENTCIIIMFTMLDRRPAPVAWMSTAFTMAKASVLGVCLLLIVAGLVALAVRRVRTTGGT